MLSCRQGQDTSIRHLGIALPCGLHQLLKLAQVSLVCRNVALAVPQVLARYLALELWPLQCHPAPTLASRLLLQWAPGVKEMTLNDYSIEMPGIREFIAAASSLIRR